MSTLFLWLGIALGAAFVVSLLMAWRGLSRRTRETLTWYARQSLPLRYSTGYTDDRGARHFVRWRMWFGRSFAVDDVVVPDARRCNACGGWVSV